MTIKQGETYICTESGCEAEIVVRRGAKPTCRGQYILRCCCGKEMVREDMLEFVKPARATPSTSRA